MNEMFSQGGKGSTGILTNKQAVARHFGVKQSEVVYFSVGVDLGGYKVIYDKETQRAYSLPAGIASGTTAVSLSNAAVLVHSAGSVDLGALAVSREEYVTLPGSFDSGSTLNVKNELLTYTDGKYRWDGALPKTVAPGSTPASTGGEGPGGWISVGDASLRSELLSPAGSEMVNHGNSKISEILYALNSVADIQSTHFENGTSYTLRGWNAVAAPVTNTYGGGDFIYSATTPRTLHNGGTIIDVSVPFTTTADYLAGVGGAGGNGCLIRKGISDELDMSWFGAVPNTDSIDSWASAQKCIDTATNASLGVLIPFSIITTKPLVVTHASTMRGVSKYKSFIFKTTDTKSGLPNMDAPPFTGGGSIVYDVDAVIIVKPAVNATYAAWVKFSDFTVEKNNNESSLPMRVDTYGIYAPYVNRTTIVNCQAQKVDYGIWSRNMWMFKIDQWRGYLVNHNIYVVEGGTSLVWQNVWADTFYDTAYYLKDIGYMNLVQVSADNCNRADVTALVYPYVFDGCTAGTANISLEETFGCGFLQITSSGPIRSNLSVTMYVNGIRNHTTTNSDPAILVYNSTATFNNCDFKLHPGSTGNTTPMFVHGSEIVSNNTPWFVSNYFAADDNASRLVLLGSTITLRGRSGGSLIETSIGEDFTLQGDWDRGGKIKFFGVNGALYGTLFANSAGDLRWKALGVPANNSDGIKLN